MRSMKDTTMSSERFRTTSPSQLWLRRTIVIIWCILFSYFIQTMSNHMCETWSYQTFDTRLSLLLNSGVTMTTGIRLFAECQIIYRVISFGHSANKLFAECQAKNHRQKTLGKVFYFWHLANSFFTKCFFNTRQRAFLPNVFLDNKRSLPSVFSTLGKDNLKIIFWSSKLIKMKIFSATNLYNSFIHMAK
jgi:hypothetical protein